MCLAVLQEEGAEYAEAPWNLNNFPSMGGNMTRHAGADVPGASRPYLDVGMMFSSAPWHLAPQLLYSATYLHTGAARKWCAVLACSQSCQSEYLQDGCEPAWEVSHA